MAINFCFSLSTSSCSLYSFFCCRQTHNIYTRNGTKDREGEREWRRLELKNEEERVSNLNKIDF